MERLNLMKQFFHPSIVRGQVSYCENRHLCVIRSTKKHLCDFFCLGKIASILTMLRADPMDQLESSEITRKKFYLRKIMIIPLHCKIEVSRLSDQQLRTRASFVCFGINSNETKSRTYGILGERLNLMKQIFHPKIFRGQVSSCESRYLCVIRSTKEHLSVFSALGEL